MPKQTQCSSSVKAPTLQRAQHPDSQWATKIPTYTSLYVRKLTADIKGVVLRVCCFQILISLGIMKTIDIHYS